MDADGQLWLAEPEAATHFDAEAQSFEDRRRWAKLRRAGPRIDWQVSRALLAHARPDDCARSLSHSAGYAALVVAGRGVRVGLDLECIDKRRDHLRLARFGFTAAEAAELESLDETARVERFYVLWTLKEACIKALGLTLLDGLKRCTFTAQGGQWRATIPSRGHWSAQVFQPVRSHYLAVVADGNLRWQQRVWPGGAAEPWRELVSIVPDGL